MASFKAKFPVLQELFAKNHRGMLTCIFYSLTRFRAQLYIIVHNTYKFDQCLTHRGMLTCIFYSLTRLADRVLAAMNPGEDLPSRRVSCLAVSCYVISLINA